MVSVLADGGRAVHSMPGTHGLMVMPPLVSIMVDALQRRLDAIATCMR